MNDKAKPEDEKLTDEELESTAGSGETVGTGTGDPGSYGTYGTSTEQVSKSSPNPC